MANDTIHFSHLSRAELNQLKADLDHELAHREHEDHACLEFQISQPPRERMRSRRRLAS